MHAVVVYESFWGNTAAVARAIAGRDGPDAAAMTTDEATAEVVSGADVIVAGAPVLGFRLADGRDPGRALPRVGGAQAGRHAPSIDAVLARGRCRPGMRVAAAFETRFRFSPGGAIGTITHEMERAGYQPIAKGKKFLVTGKYGPLKEGELERARSWGAELASAAQDGTPS